MAKKLFEVVMETLEKNGMAVDKETAKAIRSHFNMTQENVSEKAATFCGYAGGYAAEAELDDAFVASHLVEALKATKTHDETVAYLKEIAAKSVPGCDESQEPTNTEDIPDAEYSECSVTGADANQANIKTSQKGGVNPNLVSTLEGITGNKIERVQNKKEEKVMKFEDVKITAMDLLAVVSKNKQLRIAAGEKKPVAISTEEAMAMLRNPDSQFDVYRNYVLAFHQNTPPKAQKNYGDIPKGAACSAASCFEAQKKQKKYKIHDIVVKTTKMKDGKPEEVEVLMEMYLEEGTPTPQGFVAFKGKTDPVFKFAWGLDPKYGNLYYATPYVQHRPLMRDNNDNVIRDSLGRPVRQKWQRVDKKEDKLGIIKLIQDKLIELGFGNNRGIPGTEITLWG